MKPDDDAAKYVGAEVQKDASEYIRWQEIHGVELESNNDHGEVIQWLPSDNREKKFASFLPNSKRCQAGEDDIKYSKSDARSVDGTKAVLIRIIISDKINGRTTIPNVIDCLENPDDKENNGDCPHGTLMASWHG